MNALDISNTYNSIVTYISFGNSNSQWFLMVGLGSLRCRFPQRPLQQITRAITPVISISILFGDMHFQQYYCDVFYFSVTYCSRPVMFALYNFSSAKIRSSSVRSSQRLPHRQSRRCQLHHESVTARGSAQVAYKWETSTQRLFAWALLGYTNKQTVHVPSEAKTQLYRASQPF